MSDYPRYIYGVDFSADEKKAGNKTWIGRGVTDGNALLIEDCYPTFTLPGSGRGRDQCLTTLRHFIASARDAAFGLDFPFGLPKEFLGGIETWEDFVHRFPNHDSDHREFWRLCHRTTCGHDAWRLTDRKCETPLSPINWLISPQTYFGIRRILRPVVQGALACVLPMQSAYMDSRKPWILEICPGSTLKREPFFYNASGRNLQYKENSKSRARADELRENRGRILEGFEQKYGLSVAREDLRQKILGNPEGAALDSVIAAFAAFRNLSHLADSEITNNPLYMLEGYVYC